MLVPVALAMGTNTPPTVAVLSEVPGSPHEPMPAVKEPLCPSADDVAVRLTLVPVGAVGDT